MENNKLLARLVDEYYRTRPYLHVPSESLCIFYVACSGAGKSTLREQLVERLKCTYVCNDEVRAILREHPEAVAEGIELKDIVTATWQRIIREASNKTVIFDNNSIEYCARRDSYIALAKRLQLPMFVIGIESSEETLKKHIIERGVDVYNMLYNIPYQLRGYREARKLIKTDMIMHDQITQQAVSRLTQKLRSLSMMTTRG